MRDCVPSTPLPSFPVIRIPKFGLILSCTTPSCSLSHCLASATVRNRGFQFFSRISKPRTRASRDPGVLGSESYEFPGELGLKGERETRFEFKSRLPDANLEKLDKDSTRRNDNATDSTGLDSFKLKDENGGSSGDSDGAGLKLEDASQLIGRVGRRRGKQMMRRSNILAKQAISIQSALSMGFVSQLWVDTASWVVLVVEVRPNLLSGESERFLLHDVSQVGDVVLVEDENVMDNGLKMVGLETLVGYKVVTPGRRSIGKVRGFSFNINSGAIESLELDSFGISVIPSSLVSTYALLIEDVLEVLSDTVVVHEAAASRIQRLTKGFWDAKNVRTSTDEPEEYYEFGKNVRPNRSQGMQRSFRSRKFNPTRKETSDDWELPIDFL